MRFQAKLVFSTDGETEKAAYEVESADLNLLHKILGTQNIHFWFQIRIIDTFANVFMILFNQNSISLKILLNFEFLHYKCCNNP